MVDYQFPLPTIQRLPKTRRKGLILIADSTPIRSYCSSKGVKQEDGSWLFTDPSVSFGRPHHRDKYPVGHKAHSLITITGIPMVSIVSTRSDSDQAHIFSLLDEFKRLSLGLSRRIGWHELGCPRIPVGPSKGTLGCRITELLPNHAVKRIGIRRPLMAHVRAKAEGQNGKRHKHNEQIRSSHFRLGKSGGSTPWGGKGTVRQEAKNKQGITQEQAKDINKRITGNKGFFP